MIYPKNFEEKIGFKAIVELLRQECISTLGEKHVERLSFLTHFDNLQERLKETAEFKRILMLESGFPCSDYIDLSEELKRIHIEGSFISLEKLAELQASYFTLLQIVDYLNALEETIYPRLKYLNSKVSLPPQIPIEIKRILDDLGNIKDNASENLMSIRQKIRRKQGETQKYIRRYLNEAKKEGWVSEDAETTVRNERLVIPMISSHKRKIKGFIHDVSTTGQTVFIEPEEIFNLNNEIMDLLNDERLEIISILKEFSQFIRPHIPVLEQAYQFMGIIDFIRAKAKLALKLNAGIPILHDEPYFQWKDARHPLLFLSLERQNKKIVPLDLRMDKGERILIISGPNAGGKSVCLKTVGLLQYMLQCGLPVPMSEQSEAGIFNDIFVDIGDEQSIENDLSTYSSHLNNMRVLLKNGNEKSLFLADELGSGTEPQVGGAIAEAILEEINHKGCYGVVTTHYTNLKLLAQSTPWQQSQTKPILDTDSSIPLVFSEKKSFVNGAMLFDLKELRPLYILKKGSPGSSFAFEMAKNIGLPSSILSAATEKIGSNHIHFEEQLQQLEVDKKWIEQAQKEWRMADDILADTLDKYNKLKNDLEKNKNEILREAKVQAKQIVQNANAIVERTIREIKEQQAQKEITQQLRASMEKEVNCLTQTAEMPSDSLPNKAKQKIQKPLSLLRKEAQIDFSKIKLGDFVRLHGQKEIAEVVEIKGDLAILAFDFMRLKAPLESLEKIVGHSYQARTNKKSGSIGSILHNINDQKAAFSFRIDLRGTRAVEAEERIQKLLDDAVLYGEKHLEILHGKGNGILRNLCRTCLEKNPAVASFRDQTLELGGSGITVIEMK
ncbi:MAG: Smr/MutS family protein [Bacteroidales bacterium]